MSSSHHDACDIGAASVEEVSAGVYAYVQPDGSWWINNTGFLVGRRGVISVDACATERRTRAYLQAIAEVTDRPVTTVINTHHHGDHTHGNCLFDGATVVGHERCREEILSSVIPVPAGIWEDVEWGRLEMAPPFLTFDQEIAVYADNLRCHVRHVASPAHTTNDAIVWIPERSVLFAGDLLFNGGTPFVMMGSVDGALEVLDKVVRPLGAQRIVPGHGPVCGPEVIDEVADYLRFVQRTARAGVDAGVPPLDAAQRADLGRFAELLDAERLVGNLHRAYAELQGAPRGSAIDVVTALGEMITFNGGRPLSCSA